MAFVPVNDTRSNPNENIVSIADGIGRSKVKKKVVAAVYRGKRKVKSVAEIMATTGLSQVQVLDAGAELAVDGAFHKILKDGLTAFEKDTFVRILWKAPSTASSAPASRT